MLSPSDFSELMFPQPEDQGDYKYPDDGLLHAFDVVKDSEIRPSTSTLTRRHYL